MLIIFPFIFAIFIAGVIVGLAILGVFLTNKYGMIPAVVTGAIMAITSIALWIVTYNFSQQEHHGQAEQFYGKAWTLMSAIPPSASTISLIVIIIYAFRKYNAV